MHLPMRRCCSLPDLTPMMAQYSNIKSRYPDCILLFRLGDFYETFDEDAKYVSKSLGLVLTHRADHPMAGIPHHTLNLYLKKLIENGNKVAICEQLEDPSVANGIVKRDVTRIVTPGTVIEDDVLTPANNYIAAYYKGATALADISTGDFFVDSSQDSIEKYAPKHVISVGEIKEIPGTFVEKLEDWYFDGKNSDEVLRSQFQLEDLSFLELSTNEKIAASAIVKYLQMTQKHSLNLKRPLKLRKQDRVFLDMITISNLELTESSAVSLYSHMNKTVTRMGQRILKREILSPLLNKAEIEKRLELVTYLVENRKSLLNLREILSGMEDVERIISRISYSAATAFDLVALRKSLEIFEEIDEWVKINSIFEEFTPDPLHELKDLLKRSLAEAPEGEVGDGKTIARGFCKDLDEARALLYDVDDYVKRYEEKERERMGSKIKVGYNSIFGYYVEISKGYKGEIPKEYVRKQTLVNSERYTTPELNELEKKVLHASEQIKTLEIESFKKICDEVLRFKDVIVSNAAKIAFIDMIEAFAYLAIQEDYVRPTFGTTLRIVAGRHPIVEQRVNEFVANDIEISSKNNFVILTGPNMSGKSTFIRQIALISLMAQIGSFVPAKKAELKLFDRIFTRIGARDDLASNRSTFLVEMSEVATILNFATEDSLIILDEVGRGTSTFDGLSIAWAVSEYISQKVKAFTIFATHYNELAELEKMYSNVSNLTMKVVEKDGKVLFLHKVVYGTADKSYGIEVARIAGIPEEVIKRAYEIANAINSVSHMDKSVRVLTNGEIENVKRRIKNLSENQMSFFDKGGIK